MFDCMPKIEGSRDLGHASFAEKILAHPLGFSKRKLCKKLKSLVQLFLKICSIVGQKILGSCDLGSAFPS